MAEITDGAPAREAAPLLSNALRDHPAQAARYGVIAAAMEPRSVSEMARLSEESLSHDMVRDLQMVFDHMDERLRQWWDTEGLASVEGRAADIAVRVRGEDFHHLGTQVARFLEADLPSPNLRIYAVASPEPQGTAASATALSGHVVVEAIDTLSSDEIAGIVFHELTHVLYEETPPEKHRAMLDEFARSDASASTGLYTYLNEALATAAGNLYLEQRGALRDEEKEYDHPYIPVLGDVALSLLRTGLENGSTLFSGFTEQYQLDGVSALGPKAVEPQFGLSQVALLLPTVDGERVASAYYRTMLPAASATIDDVRDLADFPHLDAVRLVRFEALDALGDEIPNQVHYRAHRGFAIVTTRGEHASNYILAGRDTVAIIDAIERLGSLETLPPEGVLFLLN